MTPRTLMYRGDAMLVRHYGGEILDRGAYLAFKTPALHGHFGANFLVFRDPPGPDDGPAWLAAFECEFPDRETEPVLNAGWDVPADGFVVPQALLAEGYTTRRWQVFTARRLPPPAAPADVTVRPLDPVCESDALLELVVGLNPEADRPRWRVHNGRQLRALGALAADGHAVLMGAFDGERLLAHVGVVRGEGLARYQWVVTAEDARGRGLCRALLRAAGGWAIAAGARELVIVATSGHVPSERAYAEAGFTPGEAVGRLVRRRT